jgi:uncharacterized protein (DUF1697 family)
MAVMVSLLRGINVGGKNLIKMEALRALYASLGLNDVQTYVQSGNVVFQTKEQNLPKLTKRIEDAIEKQFGFRPEVVLRSASELREALAKNPLAKRREIDPTRILINFLVEAPSAAVCEEILKLKFGGEEVRIDGRHMYLYSPEGFGKSRLWPAVGKALKNSGTGRNLNTVQKLLEMAEKMEA